MQQNVQSHSDNINDNIIGSCKVLETNKFPTNGDVLKHYLYIRRNGNSNDSKNLYHTSTADCVIKIWSKTTIPIIRKVKSWQMKYRSICRRGKACSTYQVKRFKDDLMKLFDIAVCQCDDICKCSYQFKIPRNEKVFLADQRGPRLLSIPIGRDSRNESFRPHSKPKLTKTNETVTRPHRRSTSKQIQSENSKMGLELPKKFKLTNFVREAQRFQISKRAAATVLNAFVKDLGIINKENIVDRHKIGRQMKKQNKAIEQCHKNQIIQFLNQTSCFGLYFDGKRDQTNVYVRNDHTNRNHLRKKTEEHISLVLEPSHLFYTHVTPKNGTAECIAECIWQQLKKDNIAVEKLLFVGSDGTTVNTGLHNGKDS